MMGTSTPVIRQMDFGQFKT